MQLANAQRKSLPEILASSAFEFELWREYYIRYGFDADRIEWTTANAGAAAAQAWGSKVRSSDLVPDFRRGRNGGLKASAARLKGMKGAKVRKLTPEESTARREARRQRKESANHV